MGIGNFSEADRMGSGAAYLDSWGFFMRWALETSVKLTEWAVGLLTLIVGAAIIYSIVIHRWGDLFLYSLIFVGIMAILMAVVVVQDFCDAMIIAAVQ